MSQDNQPAPKEIPQASVTIEDRNRTVTFVQKPDRFAIHPASVTMRWAEIKVLAAQIMQYEATAELALHGVNVNTQVVQAGGGKPQ